MFTGIIEETGSIISFKQNGKSGKLKIAASKVLEDTRIGDSIAVNGICLTVVSMESDFFMADVMVETVKRSSLSDLRTGDRVNLERAMPMNGRFGGHIVSGHIDGVGIIRSFVRDENAVWVTISANEDILRYIVEKGSIAIDGISLTVAYVDNEVFKVSIIPHTGGETTLLTKKAGDKVNLENDLVGKYIEKLILPYGTNGNNKKELNGSRLTMDFLMENGF